MNGSHFLISFEATVSGAGGFWHVVRVLSKILTLGLMAAALQRPLSNELLGIVATGEGVTMCRAKRTGDSHRHSPNSDRMRTFLGIGTTSEKRHKQKSTQVAQDSGKYADLLQ